MPPERLLPRLRSRSEHDHRGTRRHLSRPDAGLTERWTTLGDCDVFYRESRPPFDAPVMMHLHGFGLSGRYLLPTARRLAGQFVTMVPDLPGFGRSGNASAPLGVTGLAEAAADLLTDRGVDRATLVGNSLGCAVICEFAHLYPERLDRAVLVSPAGGSHNQPLRRAITQLARDGVREPSELFRYAVPHYVRFGVPSTLRLFDALTHFPTLDRLLAMPVPTLVVIGDRDPLLPSRERIHDIAEQHEHDSVVVVLLHGAAHAINFSHPAELAEVIALFMADRDIGGAGGGRPSGVMGEAEPGRAWAEEIHRGDRLPATRRRSTPGHGGA